MGIDGLGRNFCRQRHNDPFHHLHPSPGEVRQTRLTGRAVQELVTMRQAGTTAATVYTNLSAADSQELIVPVVNNGNREPAPQRGAIEEQIQLAALGRVIRDVQ